MRADTPIVIDREADRVVVRLNRPKLRNAIDRETVDALHVLCAELEANPRVALFIGEGDTFASGADVKQMRERGRDDALQGINSRLFHRILRLPQPTIALLDGHALGAGAELAFACDFRIATSRLRIGNPEPSLGIAPAAGASWRLVDLVGEPLAKEMLLTGRILNGHEALEVRLVSEITEPDGLLEAGHRVADRVLAHAPIAIRLTKALIHAPRDAHPMIDDIAQAVLFETEEKVQRMTDFLERKERSQP